jgi:hypothetical protein
MSKRIMRSDGSIYNSVAEAAERIGVTSSAITSNLRGRTSAVKGFTFSYYCKGVTTNENIRKQQKAVLTKEEIEKEKEERAERIELVKNSIREALKAGDYFLSDFSIRGKKYECDAAIIVAIKDKYLDKREIEKLVLPFEEDDIHIIVEK